MILRLLGRRPVLLLAAGGCGDDGEPAGVAGLRLMDGGRVEVVVESGVLLGAGVGRPRGVAHRGHGGRDGVDRDGDCPAEIVLETTRVRLTSPIGDRAVVDASTGDEVPYVVCADEPEDPLCDA